MDTDRKFIKTKEQQKFMKREFLVREIILILILIAIILLIPEGIKETPERYTVNFNIPLGAYNSFFVNGSNSSCYVFYNGAKINPIGDNHYRADVVGITGEGSITYTILNPINITGGTIKSISLNIKMRPYRNNSKVWVLVNNKSSGSLELKNDTTTTILINNSELNSGGINVNKENITITLKGSSGGFVLNQSENDFINIRLEYAGEKIFQPRFSEIIMRPSEFRNKTIISEAEPSGWMCRSKLSTRIPNKLSRSAVMIDDGTGCLYGSWTVISGKVQESIFNTSKNRLTILARVKVDNSGVPYLNNIN